MCRSPEHVAGEIERRIMTLDLNPFDCCGCSTYEEIREACAQIARDLMEDEDA